MSIELSQNQVERMLRQYKAKSLNVGDMKIIRLDHRTADVFTGEGWSSRSRYRKMGDARWAYLSGVRLSATEVAQLPLNRAGS